MVAGAVQLTLLAAALFDISRRPQDQIKGPKPLWVGISFINTIGPLASACARIAGTSTALGWPSSDTSS